MGRVRFRGSDRVKFVFLYNNFDPGSSKYVGVFLGKITATIKMDIHFEIS